MSDTDEAGFSSSQSAERARRMKSPRKPSHKDGLDAAAPAGARSGGDPLDDADPWSGAGVGTASGSAPSGATPGAAVAVGGTPSGFALTSSPRSMARVRTSDAHEMLYVEAQAEEKLKNDVVQKDAHLETCAGISQLLTRQQEELKRMLQGLQEKVQASQDEWHARHENALRILTQRLETEGALLREGSDIVCNVKRQTSRDLPQRGMHGQRSKTVPTETEDSEDYNGPSYTLQARKAFAYSKQRRENVRKSTAFTRSWSRLPNEKDKLYFQVPSAFIDTISSTIFDLVSMVFVLGNTILISIETDWIATSTTGEPPDLIYYASLGFFIFFSLEFLARLGAEQQFIFKGPNKAWNMFDLIVLTFTMVELSGVGAGQGNVLKTLKIFRTFRVLRIFRFVADLRKMIQGILATIVSLVSAMGVLALIMFIFSLILTDMVSDEVRAAGPDNPNIQTWKDSFGRLQWTFYSLVKAMSGGIDWGDLSDSLVEVNAIYFFIFFLYISLIVYCVLNVVTAVFVEKMSRAEDATKYKKRFNEICQKFSAADEAGSGQLDFWEFEKYVEQNDVKHWLQTLELDLDNIGTRPFFDILCDASQDGSVSREQFVTGILNVHGYARSVDLFQLRFEVGDVDRKISDLNGKLDLLLRQSWSPLPPDVISPSAESLSTEPPELNGANIGQHEEKGHDLWRPDEVDVTPRRRARRTPSPQPDSDSTDAESKPCASGIRWAACDR